MWVFEGGSSARGIPLGRTGTLLFIVVLTGGPRSRGTSGTVYVFFAHLFLFSDQSTGL